jgi:hypothetical protein
MSFGTLIVGVVGFKDGVSEEKKSKVISKVMEFCEAREVGLSRDEKGGIAEIYVQDVNWNSHIDNDRFRKLEEYLNSIRDIVEYADFDLWYLNDGDVKIRLGEDE